MLDVPRLRCRKIIRPREHVAAVAHVGIRGPSLRGKRIDVVITAVLSAHKDVFAGSAAPFGGTGLRIGIVIFTVEHAIIANHIFTHRVVGAGRYRESGRIVELERLVVGIDDLSVLEDLDFAAVTAGHRYGDLREIQFGRDGERMAVGHHHELTLRIVHLVAHGSLALHAQRAPFETNRLRLRRRTGFGAGTEVGVVTHVAEHAAVAGVQTADCGPTRFSGLVALIGGRCFADAFVDEHQVLRLFAELRHGGFAVVDIRLTHRNRGGGIDLVVETVVVFQREIVAHFVEESVEREELGQVFAGRFTAETSKSQIVALGLAAVDGLLTELGKEIAEERRFVTELHIVEPQLPIHACAITQIHVEPSLVTIESVEELLRRIETTHTRTALPHGNVRPQVVRTLEAARKVEELLVVVARFVHHGPEVTSVVAPGAFDPLRVTERGADRSDEGAVGESIETGRVGAEHETIETIGELLRFEEVLLDFVHPVPFAQHTGDTFILPIVVPVAVTLLLLDTAQAETVDGVFGLQANHVVGEESVGFEVFEVVPILVLHLRRIKITISTPAFHVN